MYATCAASGSRGWIPQSDGYLNICYFVSVMHIVINMNDILVSIDGESVIEPGVNVSALIPELRKRKRAEDPGGALHFKFVRPEPHEVFTELVSRLHMETSDINNTATTKKADKGSTKAA